MDLLLFMLKYKDKFISKIRKIKRGINIAKNNWSCLFMQQKLEKYNQKQTNNRLSKSSQKIIIIIIFLGRI